VKQYAVILADCPWPYDNPKPTKAMGGVGAQYPTMTIEQLKRLPVADLAATDCLLFMWATMPKLQEALDVMKAWGFRHTTTAFVWVKLNPNGEGTYSGLGHYTNGNAELVLLGKKGHPKRIAKNVKQIVTAPRGRHSEKPNEVRLRITQLTGAKNKLELFGRKKVRGWTVLGNEVTGNDISIDLAPPPANTISDDSRQVREKSGVERPICDVKSPPAPRALSKLATGQKGHNMPRTKTGVNSKKETKKNVVSLTYEQLNDSSSLDDLLKVGKKEAAAHDKHAELIGFHRKWRAIHGRRLGHIFAMIEAKPAHPTKKNLYEEFGISQSTENRCSRLWEATKDFKEEELQDEAITAAYDRFGILPKKTKQSKGQSTQQPNKEPPSVGAWLSGCQIGLELLTAKVTSGDYPYDKTECLAWIKKLEAGLAALKGAINEK